jgi:NadR type nicotinamide-nucleotide adenylyltransferase
MDAFTDRTRVTRVVLTGSECTGKTTLATTLAERCNAALVPEFVRGFAETLGRPIDFSDHGAIARGQMALEDAAGAGAGSLIVQDTDLLSTVVYCRHYFGRCPPWIEEAAAARRPDLYLLCSADFAWVADGIRDRGGRQEEMQALFVQAVRASGVPAVEIAGTQEERLGRALAAIEGLRAPGELPR